MWWKSLLQFYLAVVIYYTLSYLGMKKIVQLDGVRDYFKMPYIPWMAAAANAIPVISIVYRLWKNKNTGVYFKRSAYLYALKGIVQFLTMVPAVTGTDDCIHRNMIDMILYGSCADMMFSGHTGITFIMAPQKQKYIFVGAVAVFLIFGEMHYTSDVIIAIIVASWLEFIIPMPEKITNNTEKITNNTEKITNDTEKITNDTEKIQLLL